MVKNNNGDLQTCHDYYCEKHYEIYKKTVLKNNKLLTIKNKNVNHESNLTLAINLFNKLKSKEIFLQVDEVLIENQPTLKNPIMKNIASLMFGYFVLNGLMENKIKHVKFVSPLNKLKIDKQITENVLGKLTKKHEIKAATKKLGIIYTQILLKNDKKSLNMLLEHAKKDDMCDSFLQGMQYVYKNSIKFDDELYKKMTSVIVIDE
jgi:hypothetical protein